jgi:hypothetical protein
VIGRESIKTYPDEIDSLGGTTNVQARASRRAKGHFYHLEMSTSLRERFKSDAAFKRRFAAALAEGVRQAR